MEEYLPDTSVYEAFSLSYPNLLGFYHPNPLQHCSAAASVAYKFQLLPLEEGEMVEPVTAAYPCHTHS
jgi:hypothetical protein